MKLLPYKSNLRRWVCFITSFLFFPATGFLSNAANVTFTFNDAADTGIAYVFKVEPVTFVWANGSTVITGDSITRTYRAGVPVTITNLFGSVDTNSANYRVTVTGPRAQSVFYIHAYTTNAEAANLIVAAPGQSSAWAAGMFIQKSSGYGYSNTFAAPRIQNGTGGTNSPGMSNYVWTLTNYVTGQGEWRASSGGGSTNNAGFGQVNTNQLTTNANTLAIADTAGSLDGSHSVNLRLDNWQFNIDAQAQGYASNLVVLSFGDSTSLDPVEGVQGLWFATFGTNGYAPWNPYYIIAGGAYTNGSASSTNMVGTIYQLGSNNVSGHGYVIATNAYANMLKWYLETSPNGGGVTLSYRTNGGAWITTLSTNLATTYGVLIHTQAVLTGWYQTQVIHSNGGPSWSFGMPQYETTGRGVRWGVLNAAGSRINQFTNIATNVLGPLLRDMAPTVLTFKYLDTAEEMTNGLPILYRVVTNFVPNCDIVFYGSHPQSNATDNADLILQDYAQRSFALTNRVAYVHTRDAGYLSSYATMSNRYGPGDGIHMQGDAKTATVNQNADLLPWSRGKSANGTWTAGTKPAGAQVPWLTGGNTWSGVQSFLNAMTAQGISATGSVVAYGSGAALQFADRADNTKTWTFYSSGGLGYLLAVDSSTMLEHGVDSDNWHYVSPGVAYSSASRLGKSGGAHFWAEIWGSAINTTNLTNHSLTASKLVRADANKRLVSSSYDEGDFATASSTNRFQPAHLALSNYVNQVASNLAYVYFTNQVALFTDNLTTSLLARAEAIMLTNRNAALGVGTNYTGSRAMEVQGGIRVSHGITNSGGASFAGGGATLDSSGNAAYSSGNTISFAGAWAMASSSGQPNFYANGFADLGNIWFGNRDATSESLVFTNTSGLVGMYARDGFLTNSINFGARSFLIETSTNTVSAPAGLVNTGAQIWSDGTNLCVVLQNTAGTRTTNKVTLTAWP